MEFAAVRRENPPPSFGAPVSSMGPGTPLGWEKPRFEFSASNTRDKNPEISAPQDADQIGGRR
jgi:hypothetical protein